MAFIAGDTSAATVGTTAALNTTGATLIVASIRYSGSPATFVTDSEGNTWTAVAALQQDAALGINQRWFYVENPSTDAAHTFTNAAEAGNIIQVMAFDDVIVPSLIKRVNAGTTGTANTSLTVGPITPDQTNSLLVAAVHIYDTVNSPTGPSPGAGWTVVDSLNATPTVVGGCIAYRYLGAAAAVSANWTWTNQGVGAGQIAEFKVNSVPSSGGGPLMRGLTRSPLINGRCIA